MRTSATDKPRLAASAALPAWLAPELTPHYQALVNRLGLAAGLIDAPHAIGFTSAARGAGVSTLAAAVGALVAQSTRTLLVDCCWQHPSQDQRFGTASRVGLFDLLRGCEHAGIELPPSSLPHLYVLPCGGRPEPGLLVSSRPLLAELIQQWKARFELIVFDLPPAMPEEPLTAWTGALDGVLLVVQAEQTVAEQARRAKQTLLACQANLLGAVLNQRRTYLPRWLA
jgi:protein-tyrosine kinase